RVYVGHSPGGMLGEQVTAARLAPLAVAGRCLAERRDVLGAARDLDRIGLPEREGIDRSGGPAAARLAVAITDRGGFAGDGYLNGATKAASLVGGSGEGVIRRMMFVDNSHGGVSFCGDGGMHKGAGKSGAEG